MLIKRWFILIRLGLFLAYAGVVSAEITPTDATRAVNSFTFSQWATVANDPLHPTQIFTGDFNGDGRADLLSYVPDDVGPVRVALSNGSSGFGTPTFWTFLDPTGDWQLIPGHFDGDGLMDLAVYRRFNGDIFVGHSDGSTFNFDALPWATVSPITGWHFTAGDFTNDGFGDLAGYLSSTGAVWVGRNDTGTFQFGAAPWTTVAPAAGWQFVAGNFDADGLLDLGGYYPNGTVWALHNQAGSSFATSQIGGVAPAAGWTIDAGQYVPSGRSELLATHDDGNIWIGQYEGICDDAFTFSQQGSVTPPTGWMYRSGDFNNDGRSDALAYYPPTGSVQVALTNGLTVALSGYAWPQSAEPSQPINFYLTGQSTGNVQIYRHSADAGGVHSTLMDSFTYLPTIQTTNNHPERFGTGWNVSFFKTIPAWPSGIYSATVVDLSGNPTYIPFIIKPQPSARAEVAILANTNTWLAYNGWGCGSKYDGKANVSFLRPNPAASPLSGIEGHHLTQGELWTHTWLRSRGLAPDVFSDLDLHNNGLPSSYKVLILTTHPEYWSHQMINNLRTFLNNGGTLLYLGGNGLFERGSYYGDQSGMVFRAGVEGGPRENALFRRLSPPDPERNILGVATEACGVAGAPYAVQAGMAGHFLFDGTALNAGDTFGATGLSFFGGGGASGWETDTSTGAGALGIPSDCDMGTTATYPVSPYPSLPASFIVLAKGTNAGGVGGEMTYYVHSGGGVVFSVGSLNFGGSLAVDPVIQQIVCNVLKQAGVDCGVPTAIGLSQSNATPAFSAPLVLIVSLLLVVTGFASWRLRREQFYKPPI